MGSSFRVCLRHWEPGTVYMAARDDIERKWENRVGRRGCCVSFIIRCMYSPGEALVVLLAPSLPTAATLGLSSWLY